RDLDLLAQDLRVEQVLNADPESRGLVRVAGPDPAARGADLELAEPPLAGAVDGDVPGHDQVRLAGEVDVGGRDAARFELVDLRKEDLRVDDAAGADHARLARDHAARDLADLERLGPDHDRVTGVRAA